MVILGTTIFFCHSLIRLCMLVLHPPEETPRIPSMAGPDGFQPVRPIRVHLVRDEEMGSDSDHDPSDPLSDVPDADKKLVVNVIYGDDVSETVEHGYQKSKNTHGTGDSLACKLLTQISSLNTLRY